MPSYADRVRQLTTTTGTGAVTLSTSVNGFRTFATAFPAASTEVYYCISETTPGAWEVGIGTFTLATNVLTRTTVLSSSNAGALVNFGAGSKDVFVTMPAGRSVDTLGTGVSGTWGISVSGNAATATTLATARTLTIGSTGKSFNGSANVSWSIDEIGAEVRQPLSVPRNNLGDPTVREAALFQEQFNNKIDLFPIANFFLETSTDNVTWSAFALSDTEKRKLVGGDGSIVSSLIIPYGTAYFRIRMRANTYVYLNAAYCYWSSNGHTTQVRVYSKHDNDAGWTVIANSSTSVGSWPGHLYLPHSTIPWNNGAVQGNHVHEVVLHFTPSWNASYPSNGISLYKLQWWGGYPAGKRTPYSVNEMGLVTFPYAVTVVGALTQNGNTVLSSANYNTYSPTLTGGGASGTWPISISGSAESVDGIDSVRIIYGSNGSGSNTASTVQNVYEIPHYKSGFWEVNNASWAPTATGWYWGATFAHTSNSSGYNFSGQLAFAINGGGENLYARTIDLGTPSSWSRLLSSGNYNDYAPTKTGTGASGTWGISITGNAATVTDGVYATGSYADPAWITSLNKSKVSLGNVENTALSTWAGSTNITTLGTVVTGTWNATTIGIAKGGTGATTAAAALTALAGAERGLFPTSPVYSLRALDSRSIANPSTGIGFGTGGRFRFAHGNDVDSSDGYADVIDLSTYNDASGGGYNSLYFKKNGQRIQHKYATSAATSWTTKTLAYDDQTFYLGTTQIAINRASAALVLTGITSIDGNAATVTNGVYTTGSYADPTWITSLAKSKVSLGNVDNTSDVDKPVSTATQTALNGKADTGHKYHSFSNGQYFFDTYEQANYLRAFTENSVSDIIRFAPISNIEYYNGSAWVAWAGADSNIQSLLDGRENTGFALSHTNRNFRFTVTRTDGWPTNCLLTLQTTWTAITYPGVVVTIEHWNGSAWVLKDTATFTSANGVSNWGTALKATSGLHDGITTVRIQVNWTDWVDSGGYTTVPMRGLSLYSNYSSTRPLVPWSWNYNKLVTFDGNIAWTGTATGTAQSAIYLNGTASSTTADNITTRVNSGFWETSTATTAEGWPTTNNSWYHLLSSTHSNGGSYYAMQLAAEFGVQNLYYRSTNNNGSTAWSKVILDTNIASYLSGATAGATTQSSGNVTLTNASTGVQSVTLTAHGQWIKLPSATTMSTGMDRFAIVNRSPFWGTIKDNAGTVIAILGPLKTIKVSLVDNSTAAGVWNQEGGSLLGMTAEFSTSLSGTDSPKIFPIELDSDRTMILFGSGSAYAVIWTESTASFGSAVLVKASITNKSFCGILTSAGTVTAICNSSAGWQGIVLTTSGSTITVNTASTASGGNSPSIMESKIFSVGTSYLYVYVDASSAYFRAFTVSGTTVTFGAQESTGAGTNFFPHCYVTGSSFVVISHSNDASNFMGKAYTLSGTTITGGSVVYSGGGGNNNSNNSTAKSLLLASGRIVFVYRDTGGYLSGTLFSASGTTLTASNVSNLGTYDSLNFDIIECNGKVILGLFSISSNDLSFQNLTDTSGVLSKGTAVVTSGNASNLRIVAVGISGTNAYFSCTSYGTTSNYTFKVDAAGASPAISVVGTPLPTYSSNSGYDSPVETLSPKQSQGVRDTGQRLVSGSLVIPIPDRLNRRSLIASISTSGHTVVVPVEFYAYDSRGHLSNSVVWTASSGGTSSTIFALQRVQCAP